MVPVAVKIVAGDGDSAVAVTLGGDPPTVRLVSESGRWLAGDLAEASVRACRGACGARDVLDALLALLGAPRGAAPAGAGVKLEGAALRVAWEGAGGELELRDSAFCWEAVRAMAAAPDLLAAALAAEQRHGERTAAALGRVAAEKAALEQRLLPAAAALLQRKRERNTELYRQLSGAAAEARSPGPTPPKRRPPPRKGGGASLAVPAAPAAPAAVGVAGPAGAGGAAPVPYAELPETESEGEGPGGRVWQPARPWGRRDSEERYVEDTDAEEAGAAPGPGGGRTPPRSPREQRGVTPPATAAASPALPATATPPAPALTSPGPAASPPAAAAPTQPSPRGRKKTAAEALLGSSSDED